MLLRRHVGINSRFFLRSLLFKMTQLSMWLYLFFEMVLIQSYPLNMRLVDMTHEFNNNTLHFPTMKKFSIEVVKNGTEQGKYWLQYENYESGIHVGTHIDAPCHFAKGRWTLDQIPVERFFLTAAVIDVEAKAQADVDYQATIQDLKDWEIENNKSLIGNIILLLKTGWGKRWGNKELYQGTSTDDVDKLHYPGLHPEAAEWLIRKRNISATGTETFSLDYGQAKENKVHATLLGNNIYFLENVANLWELPPYGAQLLVMPMKIGKTSGAPVRVFAYIKQS